MTEHVAAVEHSYPVSYVPRGARNPVNGHVKTSTPVSVRGVDASSVSLALVVERASKGTISDDDLTLVREELHACDGLLLSEARDKRGLPMGIEALSFAGELGTAGWSGRSNPFYTGSAFGSVLPDRLERIARRVVSTGEDEARSKVRAAADGCRLADGVLYAPGDEPVWTVSGFRHHDRTPTALVVPCRAYQMDTAHSRVAFRADDLDGAMEYARWLVGVLAEETGREARLERRGSIEVLDPSVLAVDPARLNAGHAIRRATYGAGTGFETLPVPALRAWADFREALPFHEAGNDGATADCIAALHRVLEALPPEAARLKNRMDGTSPTRLYDHLWALRYIAGPITRRLSAGSGMEPEDEAALLAP